MSQRYDRLYLFGTQYAEGAPLLISAGALLKDNQTGDILAQLKLENLEYVDVSAVTVRIQPMDAARRPFGEPFLHQFLDLKGKKDIPFGQQQPIPMPAMARAFSAEVTEVIFSDFSLWNEQGQPWLPLPPKQELKAVLQQDEVCKQYRMIYGKHSAFYPAVHRDLWYCACGSINRTNRPVCRCGNELDVLLACDLHELREQTKLRLEEERAEREAAQKAAAEKAAADKARRLTLLKKYWYILAAAVVLLAALILVPTVSFQKKMDAYVAATEQLNTGNYEEAIAEFAELGNFRDSAAQKAAAEEALAEKLAEEQRIAEEQAKQAAAREAEQEENRKRAAYAIAAARMQRGEYESALAKWQELGDYRDSQNQIAVCEVELIWQDYRQAADAEAPDFAAAEAALEQLSAIETNLAGARMEDGYHALAVFACENDLPEQAEGYLPYITDTETSTALQQEIANLKLYVQAKAITVEDKETRDALDELLKQLPEDYRDVADMRQQIKDFDRKQNSTSATTSNPATSSSIDPDAEEYFMDITMANLAGRWQEWRQVSLSDGTSRWIVCRQMTLGSNGSFKEEDGICERVDNKLIYELDENGNILYTVKTGTYSIGNGVLNITCTDQNGETKTYKYAAVRLSNRFIYKYNVGDGVDFKRA